MIAQAVSLLAAVPEEMSVPGLGQVLDILTWVSSKGALVSVAAANRVAEGLSSVVSGVGLLDPAYGPDVSVPDDSDAPASSLLKSVVGILGLLSDSIGRGLSVPEERPVFVLSEYFKMAVRYQSIGRDTSLTTSPFSAPGSTSVFNPLPASAVRSLAVGVAQQQLGATNGSRVGVRSTHNIAAIPQSPCKKAAAEAARRTYSASSVADPHDSP